MSAIKPFAVNATVANVFRIYDRDLAKNEAFACGWRMWSFQMTEEGNPRNIICYKDHDLIMSLKEVGAAYLNSKQAEWNKFRTGVMRLLPDINPSQSFSDQYRSAFKRIAFVMIDCCFIAKYRITSTNLKELVTAMFQRTGTLEIPKYLIIIENDIMFAEINHKLMSDHDFRYKNAIEGINSYLEYNPSMMKDGIIKMGVPFVTTHMSMQKAERKVSSIKHTHNVSRNNFNDFAQLFLMNYIRKSFQQCARIALLSDDYHFLKYANGFIPSQLDINHAHSHLPDEYTKAAHIVTPMLLEQTEWDDWRSANLYN